MSKILKNIGEKAFDTKTALNGLVLANILLFINSLLKKVDILIKQYDNVESLLYPKRYVPILQAYNIVKPKTLIAGFDNNSLNTIVNNVNTDLKGLIEMIQENLEDLNVLKQRLDNDSKGKINITEHIDFLIEAKTLISTVKEMTRKVNLDLRIQIPNSKSTLENGKYLRKLLTDSQAIAREAEILFVYFIKPVLKEHGQIRRDYAEIQSQTNQIYRNLSLGAGEITLDGDSLGHSLKMIMKALKNIRGDLNSLKIITVTLMRPKSDEPAEVRNLLSKLAEKGNF